MRTFLSRSGAIKTSKEAAAAVVTGVEFAGARLAASELLVPQHPYYLACLVSVLLSILLRVVLEDEALDPAHFGIVLSPCIATSSSMARSNIIGRDKGE